MTPQISDRLQWASLSADCVLLSSIASLSAGLKKLASGLLARQASALACPLSSSCLLYDTSLTAPDSRNIPFLRPS